MNSYTKIHQPAHVGDWTMDLDPSNSFEVIVRRADETSEMRLIYEPDDADAMAERLVRVTGMASRDAIKDTCTRACETVRAASIASRTGTADRWQFASTYFNELARQAAAEVEPRWRDRLGGVEAFTHSHCLSMTIALAHEWE